MNVNTPTRTIRLDNRAIFFVLGLIGTILVLVSSQHGGIRVTNDSIHFLTAARSLLNGEGYLRFNRIPFASWPPVYPTLIAGVNLITRTLGIDIMEGMRFAQALILGLAIYLSGVLYWRVIPSKIYALLALLTVVFAFPLLRISNVIWTESLFIVLSLAFILYLPRFLEAQKIGQLALLMLLAALATMDRFAGIGIIPFGMVVIMLFMRPARLAKRLLYSAIFALSAIPYAAWLYYGLVILPTPSVGGQQSAVEALILNLGRTAELLTAWFVPATLNNALVSLLVGLGLVGLVAGIILAYFRHPTSERAAQPLNTSPVLIALYIAVYLVFFYLAHILVNTTPVDQRHLSVLYVYVMLLVFYGLSRLSGWARKRWLRQGVFVLASLVVAYAVITHVTLALAFSEWCCDAERDRQLESIQWLKAHPLDGTVYSNTPFPLYYTPLAVYGAPAELDGWAAIPLSPDRDSYLVWYKDTAQYAGLPVFYYELNYSADDLAAQLHLPLERLVETSDAAIYTIKASAST